MTRPYIHSFGDVQEELRLLYEDAGTLQAVFGFSGDLEVATGDGSFPVSVDCSILSVIASVGTAPTGDDLILDVNKNGTTVFTTQDNRPTIAEDETVSATATPDVTSVVVGDVLSVDIDQIGSTLPGSDLTVVVLLRAT